MTVINETIFPYQIKALSSKKKIIAVISGTGAGKTYCGAIRLGLWGLNSTIKNGIYYAVGPTRTHLKSFLWFEFIQFLGRLGLVENVDYDYNKTDLVVTFFRNGTRVMGKSAEVPNSLQGGHVLGIVLDESGLYSKEVFEVAKQRISLYDGQIFIVTTPYTWNWLKKDLYDVWITAERDHPEIEILQVDSLENPFFSKDAYFYAKKTMPKWRFDMFFRGIFTKPAGLCYDVFYTTKAINIKNSIPGSNWRFWAGVDYGFHNPTAGCLFAENQDGQIFLIESFKKPKLSLDALYNILKDWNCVIYMDPSAAGIIAELKNKGLFIHPAKNEVVAGIMLVNDFLNSRKLLICKGAGFEDFEEEISSYSWAVDANGDPLEKVNKINDHLMDAMRYGIMSGSGFEKPTVKGLLDFYSTGGRLDSWSGYDR